MAALHADVCASVVLSPGFPTSNLGRLIKLETGACESRRREERPALREFGLRAAWRGPARFPFARKLPPRSTVFPPFRCFSFPRPPLPGLCRISPPIEFIAHRENLQTLAGDDQLALEK